ncbi:MAG: tetratricopeptide repeat protein, partial [Methylococcales bacterium]
EKVEQEFQQLVEKHNQQPRLLFDLSSWMVARGKLDEAKKVLNQVVELEENTDVGLKAKTVLAKIAFENRNLEESGRIVDDILSANSNYDDAKILQARLLLVKEKYDEAIMLLNKILWSKADSEEAMLLLGQAYLIKGDQKQADKQFSNALAVNAASKQAFDYVYEKALNSKDVKYIKEILDNAIRLRPDNIDFLEKMAKVHMLENKWDDAVVVVEKIKGIPNPLANDLAIFLRGEIYQGRGEFAKAITEYKTLLEKFPQNSDALGNMARCYEKLNKRSEMVAFLTGILAKNSNNLPAGILLSDLYLINKEYAKANTLLTDLIKNNPKVPQLYIAMASLKSAQNDNKAAIQVYQDGLRQSPGHIKLSLSLASLLEDQGEYDAALSAYETILAKNPQLDVAKNNLATLLIEHYTDQDKLNKAIEIAEKFKDSDQPYYRDTYAWTLIKTGKTNEGLDILNNIIINSPDVPVFRYHLAVANYKNGNATMAMAELREALELAAKKGGFSDKKAAETLLQEIMDKRKGG